MSTHERIFQDRFEVTHAAPAPDVKMDEQVDEASSVVVELQSGTRCVHRTTRITRYNDRGHRDTDLSYRAEYEVAPSGALHIISTTIWRVGWDDGVNDSRSVVCTYGPGQWVNVTGPMMDDPHAAAFRLSNERRRARLAGEAAEAEEYEGSAAPISSAPDA